FLWDSNGYGYLLLAGALAWGRSGVVVKAVVGRRDSDRGDSPHSEAFWSSRQRAWGLGTVSRSAESAGGLSLGLVAIANKCTPQARALHPARAQRQAGRVPSRSPSHGSGT